MNRSRSRRTRAAAGVILSSVVLTACTAAPQGSPSSSPSVSAPSSSVAAPPTSASPTPTYLSTVREDPLLPTAHALPAGLLATTDSAWVIVQVSATSDASYADGFTTALARYLVDPEGVRYQLPDLPDDEGILEWLPGTALALATLYTQETESTEVAVVDLESGKVVAPVDLSGFVPIAGTIGASVSVTFVGDTTTDVLVSASDGERGLTQRRSLDGQVRASVDAPWSALLASPDGTTLLVIGSAAPTWVDPVTLRVIGSAQTPTRPCVATSWLDDTRVFTHCSAEDWSPSWFVAAPDETWQLQLPDATWVDPMVGNPDGSVLVVVGSPQFPGGRVERVSATGASPVASPVSWVLATDGPRVLGTDGAVTDNADLQTAALVAWDTSTDSATTLIPSLAPPAGRYLALTPQPGDPPFVSLYLNPDGTLDVYAD